MSDARDAIEEMLARLGQSHFALMPREVYDDLDVPTGAGARDGDAGLVVRVIDGHALVTRVHRDSAGEAAGVQRGWEILRVDDFDVATRIGGAWEQLAALSGRDAHLSLVVMARLTGPVGKHSQVVFLNGDDQRVARELTFTPRRGTKTRFGHFPEMYVWTEVQTLESNIGYIAFSLFMDPATVMPAFNAAMQAFRDAPGVIIDLRGNQGGIGAMAMGMAGWLIDADRRYLGTMYTREGEFKYVVSPRAETYAGPVAILQDGLSASTSEILVGGLRDLGRVRVFGTRSAGAALPSVAERLPNGDGFQYAFANYISAGGVALEGHGVAPDVEVLLTRAALLRGEDRALMAAIAWIRNQGAESAWAGAPWALGKKL